MIAALIQEARAPINVGQQEARAPINVVGRPRRGHFEEPGGRRRGSGRKIFENKQNSKRGAPGQGFRTRILKDATGGLKTFALVRGFGSL